MAVRVRVRVASGKFSSVLVGVRLVRAASRAPSLSCYRYVCVWLQNYAYPRQTGMTFFCMTVKMTSTCVGAWVCRCMAVWLCGFMSVFVYGCMFVLVTPSISMPPPMYPYSSHHPNLPVCDLCPTNAGPPRQSYTCRNVADDV